MQVRQTNRLGRRSFDVLLPYADISTGRSEVTSQPGAVWVVIGALFGAGALINVVARDDEWLSNAVVGLLISAALGVIWLAKRTPWVGFPPLMLVGRSERTEEFLQRVMDRRAEHIVMRTAEHGLTHAFRLIEEWKSGNIISEGEARRLWDLVQAKDRGTGGYL